MSALRRRTSFTLKGEPVGMPQSEASTHWARPGAPNRGRRLHDTNRSGVYSFLALILSPIILPVLFARIMSL